MAQPAGGPPLQVVFTLLHRGLQDALTRLFVELGDSGAAAHFHPHPFSPEEAEVRCRYAGPDCYLAAVAGGEVLGYGMLRGWEAGFEVPSLGIALARRAEGLGIGRAMMEALHDEARRRGAARVRLRVHPDNARALRLYRRLGYEFAAELDRGQLVGILRLESPEGGIRGC
jgi:ribosomal protein S18 acetylase RimI-like enzyme